MMAEIDWMYHAFLACMLYNEVSHLPVGDQQLGWSIVYITS